MEADEVGGDVFEDTAPQRLITLNVHSYLRIDFHNPHTFDKVVPLLVQTSFKFFSSVATRSFAWWLFSRSTAPLSCSVASSLAS